MSERLINTGLYWPHANAYLRCGVVPTAYSVLVIAQPAYNMHMTICCVATQVKQHQQMLSDALSDWEHASRGALQSQEALLQAAQDGTHGMHEPEQRILHLTTALKQSKADAHKAERSVTRHYTFISAFL